MFAYFFIVLVKSFSAFSPTEIMIVFKLSNLFKGKIVFSFFKSVTDASSKLDINFQIINNAVYDKTLKQSFYFLKDSENIEELLKSRSNNIKLSETIVYKYSITGELLKSYNSIKEATLDVVKANHGNIIRAIKW